MYLNYKGLQLSIGDTLRVHVKIGEEDGKIQSQIFEGILMAIDNRGSNKMFRLRKIATDSIGVERIFPVDSPGVLKIELKRKGEARRAKLHYLRARVGKEAVKVKGRYEGEKAEPVIVASTEKTPEIVATPKTVKPPKTKKSAVKKAAAK